MRVLCALATALVLAPLKENAACGLALFLASVLLLIAKPKLRPLLARLGAVNIFILFLVLVVPFTVPGTPCTLLPAASREGISLALLTALKANALVACFMALLSSMDPATAGYAMERLHFPAKLVFLLLFTLRFIHTIAGEWTTLVTAAKLRGFTPKSTAHGYRTLGCLLGVLLMRSHARAKRVHEAMLLRGFDGHFRSVTAFRAGWRDLLLAGIVLCGLTAILWCEFANTTTISSLLLAMRSLFIL